MARIEIETSTNSKGEKIIVNSAPIIKDASLLSNLHWANQREYGGESPLQVQLGCRDCQFKDPESPDEPNPDRPNIKEYYIETNYVTDLIIGCPVLENTSSFNQGSLPCNRKRFINI